MTIIIIHKSNSGIFNCYKVKIHFSFKCFIYIILIWQSPIHVINISIKPCWTNNSSLFKCVVWNLFNLLNIFWFRALYPFIWGNTRVFWALIWHYCNMILWCSDRHLKRILITRIIHIRLFFKCHFSIMLMMWTLKWKLNVKTFAICLWWCVMFLT